MLSKLLGACFETRVGPADHMSSKESIPIGAHVILRDMHIKYISFLSTEDHNLSSKKNDDVDDNEQVDYVNYPLMCTYLMQLSSMHAQWPIMT